MIKLYNILDICTNELHLYTYTWYDHVEWIISEYKYMYSDDEHVTTLNSWAQLNMCSIKFLEQNKIVSNTRVYKYIHQLYILPELRTKIHKLNDVENVRFWYVIWIAVMCVLCALDLLFSIYSLQADRISILSGYSYTCTLLYWHSRSETFKHTRSATYFQVIFASRLFPRYLQNSSVLPQCSLTLVSDDRRPTGRHTCSSDTFHP